MSEEGFRLRARKYLQASWLKACVNMDWHGNVREYWDGWKNAVNDMLFWVENDGKEKGKEVMMMSSKCIWTLTSEGDGDAWKTGCDNLAVVMEGTPSENSMAYCWYCGKHLECVVDGEPDAE